MIRNIAILSSILFLGLLVIPIHAQTSQLANHVVINEIDINPPGDDSTNISEWVEIYNPTSSSVDIGGWQIASTTTLKKTMTIPSGTIIGPGKFMTFSYQPIWFTDISEIVELRNKNGTTIDKTALLTDIKNDFNSWQRIYDGFDSDTSNDWKFATSTAGASNGKFQTQEEIKKLVVTISTDKDSYLFGETAIISGTVSEQKFITKPFFQQEPIKLTIKGPNFHRDLTFYPDLNLKYKTSLNLYRVLGINEGTYDLSATYSDSTATTSFAVGTKLLHKDEVTQGELMLSTDKQEYIPGQTLTITGGTTETIPLEGLKFKITNPSGKVISTGTLFPTNGKFMTNIFLTTVNPVFGTYEITGEYLDQSAKTSFVLAQDLKEDKPISLWTDKDVYGLGETVSITGRLNNQWVSSLDLLIVQTTNLALGTSGQAGGGSTLKIAESVRIDGDGRFQHLLKIPNDKLRLGDYRITVSKELGSQSKSIVVVSDPQNFVSSTDELTIKTDKTTYSIGDAMKISGKILNPVPRTSLETASVNISIETFSGKPVTITSLSGAAKTNAQGVLIPYQLTAIPDQSGTFSVAADVKSGIFSEGTYVIKAKYLNLKTSTVVDVQNTLKTPDGISATLDKQVYGFDETVTLTGVVPPQGEGGLFISLTKPDGSKINSGAKVDNQRFTWTWKTPLSKQTLADTMQKHVGVYKVSINSGSLSKELFFKLSQSPQNDVLIVPPLTVSTEKSIYTPGEMLKIKGSVIERSQGTEGLVVPERVSIKVLSGKPPYPLIREGAVYPKQGGIYEILFELPATVFPSGEYKVKANYLKKQAESTFSVANNYVFGLDEPVSLIVSTDKKEYNPGDTVLINGKPNKLVYLKKFDVSVIQQSDTQITCGSFYCGKHLGPVTQIRPNPDGSFSHMFTVPNTPSSVGSYEVTVDVGFDTKSIVFQVVEKQPVQIPQKIIEKVNRIAESSVSIVTKEKSIDGHKISPRVLLGSLLTPIRGDESVVNLKISSESGVCVIGQESECLVKNSTRKPGSIYEIVELDGMNLNVRYSGPDSRIEKFSILPTSNDEPLPDSEWSVEVIKDEQSSRLYYTVNYSTE